MAAGYLNANPSALPGISGALVSAIRELLCFEPQAGDMLPFAATIDGTLWSIFNANVDTCAEIRPTNACSSANNPIYFGNFLLDKYTPLSGNVGTLLMAPFTFKATGAISRASSS